MLTLDEIIPAISTMQKRIQELTEEIKGAAKEGDILGCDIRHANIEILVKAQAILAQDEA